jgi:hypothetical protein
LNGKLIFLVPLEYENGQKHNDFFIHKNFSPSHGHWENLNPRGSMLKQHAKKNVHIDDGTKIKSTLKLMYRLSFFLPK